VKFRNASSSFTLSFFCFPLMRLNNKVFISYVCWYNNNLIYEWKMLQTASVKVQATNVRCRVYEWTMTIVNDKCLKLQVASVRCKVYKWTSVMVLDEWVRCKIFELVKGWNNKRGWKPRKAYSHPIHHRHHVKDHCAKRLSIEGCHARGMSAKGSFVMSLTVTPISLQFTY